MVEVFTRRREIPLVTGYKRRWIPIEGLELYLPLWHPELKDATIISKDLNAHSCTVTGATWGYQGRTFDGANDYITVPSASSIDNLSAMTLSAWIKPTSAGESSAGRIFHKALDDNTKGWRFGLAASNSLYFGMDYDNTDLAVRTSNSSFSLSTWFQVALTWYGSLTATNTHIYINGVEATYQTQTDAVGNRVSDAAQNLLIGNTPDTSKSYDGVIGEGEIYNRVSSASEILGIQQATKWRYV